MSPRTAIQAASIILLCSLSSACITVKFGTPLVTEGLNSLELGASTHADILLALGQPRGNGLVHMAQDPDPREILFYEYIWSDGRNMELEILTVFMLDGHYDGHLWFASSERIRQKGGIPWFNPDKIVQGYFPDTAPLDKTFVRGMTQRAEVLGTLGMPTGIGGAVLPPEHRVQDVLFFEDVEVVDIASSAGYMVANTRQRILLVLLSDDVFDGFMWYSNVGVAEVKAQ